MPGFFHILIFGGFVVLTVRSIALVVEGSIPGFVLLPGAVGDLLHPRQGRLRGPDARRRRCSAGSAGPSRGPKRLDLSWDAWLILFLIGVPHGDRPRSRRALTRRSRPRSRRRWSPVVTGIARMLAGTSPVRLRAVYETCWWIHLVDLLFFGNYLPYSKHFHIITAVPNVFFMNLAPMGRLKTVDLENSERFGASRIEDLTWKSMLDGYTCTECGRCRVVCPTALTGKPLDPKIFIGNVRDAVYEATPVDPRYAASRGGRGNGAAADPRKELIGGWISEDTIWACTMCGFCTTACPVFIVPAVDKIVEMRRYLVLDKAEFPKEVQNAFRGMETNGNPWNISASSRADWADGLPVVTMAEVEGDESRSSSGWAARSPTRIAPSACPVRWWRS